MKLIGLIVLLAAFAALVCMGSLLGVALFGPVDPYEAGLIGGLSGWVVWVVVSLSWDSVGGGK